MKITIQAPENLSEITLRQYQDFLAIETPDEGDVLRVFLRLHSDVIGKLPATDVQRIGDDIKYLLETPVRTHQQLVPIFKFQGKRWGFIPSLDEINHGEDREVNKYLTDWQQMHKAMAVLYRPITVHRKGRYLIEDFENVDKHSDQLRDMPLSVVMGVIGFLYILHNDLWKNTPNYILSLLTEAEKTMKVSLPGQEGMPEQSVKEILDGLVRLPDQ